MEISQAVDLIVYLIQDILATKIKDHFQHAQQLVEIRSDLPLSNAIMEINLAAVPIASLIQDIHALVVLGNHLLVQYLGEVDRVVMEAEVEVEVEVPALVLQLDNLLLDHQAQHAVHPAKKVAQLQEALALIEEIRHQEAQQVLQVHLQQVALLALLLKVQVAENDKILNQYISIVFKFNNIQLCILYNIIFVKIIYIKISYK